MFVLLRHYEKQRLAIKVELMCLIALYMLLLCVFIYIGGVCLTKIYMQAKSRKVKFHSMLNRLIMFRRYSVK